MFINYSVDPTIDAINFPLSSQTQFYQMIDCLYFSEKFMYEPIKYNLKLFNTTTQLLTHFDAVDNREGAYLSP